MRVRKLGLLSILVLLGTVNCTAQKICQHLHQSLSAMQSQKNDNRLDSFDVLHYHINADFLDYQSQRKIDGVAVLKIHKKVQFQELRLDLLGLDVEHIVLNHLDTVAFDHLSEDLRVNVGSIAQGDTFLMQITYSGTPKKDARWGGFYFSGDYAFNLGVGFDADPHNYGRVWFPCVDNFVDRATYSFNIRVDSPAVAMCNGTIGGIIELSNGLRSYHWDMDQPIPTYLASVAIAPYQLLESQVDGIPVTLAAVASDTSNTKSSFENLDQCIQAFVKRYGRHSFDRIGFNMVPFNGGAMEHATNIAYPRFGIQNGSKTYETLFAHELAHHWWGNTVTCRSQEDMWINEGWASFSERIFLEEVYGKERYKDDIRSNHKAVVHYAHIRDGESLAVSGIGHSNTYGMHVYDKGADMVHTLRGFMGDSSFFAACESFQSAHKFKDVSTEDMEEHFQSFTSVPLNNFFKQWIKTQGFAQFFILSIELNDTDYVIRIKQNQKFNQEEYKDVVHFISAFSADMKEQEFKFLIDGQDHELRIAKENLEFEPVYWALDFNERISDAITDQWSVIRSEGEFEFPEALFEGEVISLTDSALLRVEHHWVSPDQYFNKIPGLAMSKERYWTVDGVWPDSFELHATFKYNGLQTSTNPANGYLDNELIKITEDSLVLLYRPNAISNWQIHPNYTKNMGSVFNKIGEMVVEDVKKGQYAFGIYDQALLSILEEKKAKLNYTLYPNPAKDELNISFEQEHDCCLLEITNLQGKVVLRKKIKSRHQDYTADISELAAGVYFVGMITGLEAYEPKRLVVQD